MATPLIREVNADVVKRGATRAVYAKQNDYNSRFLNVRIQEDGLDKTIDPSAIIILNVQRSDQQKNYFYGEVNENGTVKVPLTAWMLELEGTLACDISIIYEGEKNAKLTTMQFNIYVEASVNPESSFIETEEYSIIVDLLDRIEEAAKKAEEAAAAVIGCEDAAVKANKAADKANAVREEVEAGGYIESLKEINKGTTFKTWIGTEEEYNEQTNNGTEYEPNCLYITDDVPIADYIVEQGTSGIWKYTKWASGKIELWTNSIPHTINFTNYGSIFLSAESGILVPIVTDIESVNGDSTQWHYVNWTSVTKNGNSNSKIDIRYYGINENGNGNTIKFSAHVIGRWK